MNNEGSHGSIPNGLRCAFCKTQEAQFGEYGVPICLNCLDVTKPNPTRNTSICALLIQNLTDAKSRLETAASEFNSILGKIDSSLPHPDGSQRFRNASSELAAARKKKERAQDSLSDYLRRGIVPKDLEIER